MTFRRVGNSFIDSNPNRAEQDRENVSAIQDLQGEEIAITSPAVADTEFMLAHGLRTLVPRSVVTLRTTKGGVVYASRFSDWDKRRIFLKCTKASDELLLWVR